MSGSAPSSGSTSPGRPRRRWSSAAAASHTETAADGRRRADGAGPGECAVDRAVAAMMSRMTWHPARLPSGRVDLSAISTDDTAGFEGGKRHGKATLFAMGEELSNLQERLF